MTPFAIYELKAAVILGVFYMFYRLLLSRETFHRLNRMVLVGTAVLAMVLPLMVITIYKEIPAVQSVAAESAGGVDLKTGVVKSFPWANAIIFAGMFISLSITAMSVLKTMFLIKGGELVDESDGVRVVVLDREISPFSWMKTIVLSRIDWEIGDRAILLHERAHIRLHHSWDVVAVDILTSFQWFNPAMWMLRDDLRMIHEYQADDMVLRNGVDARQYQYLLIKKAIGKSGYSVANGLNHSTLKKRISMMSIQKSKFGAFLKALCLIPVIGICLVANARTVYVPAQDGDQSKPVLYKDLDEKPSFNGGDIQAFAVWVGENLTYPKEAVAERIQGRVAVSFTVAADGGVKDVKILRGVNELLDAEALRVVNASPEWTPGKKHGKPVDVQLVFPVTFSLK